jgi:hypothetical protein
MFLRIWTLAVVLTVTTATCSTALGAEFGAEKYPLPIAASSSNHVMSVEGGLSVKCAKTTLSSELVEPSQMLVLTPTYSECLGFGLAATIKPEGCTYRLDANATDLDFVCPVGKSMVVNVGPGVCEVQIGSQEGLQSVGLEASGGSPLALTMNFNLAKIKYTILKDTFLCPLNGTGLRENGTYVGTSQQVQLLRADPAIVSVGDSYIAGEGGRWAGNTALVPPTGIDALGAGSYEDAGSLCHRSTSAEIHIGGITSANFACSGSLTVSTGTKAGEVFKPGVDFFLNAAQGQEGQALRLEKYASTHIVRMVAISIGGNDFQFGSVITTCAAQWAAGGPFCKDLPNIKAIFSQPNVGTVQASIRGAIENVAIALDKLGYKTSRYTIVVQNYPTVFPLANGFRIGEGPRRTEQKRLRDLQRRRELDHGRRGRDHQHRRLPGF